MTDGLRKVRTGDDVGIPADGWNLALDAARTERSRQTSRGRGNPAPAPTPGLAILVRNTTSEIVPRFGAVALGGPVIAPSVNAEEFSTAPCLDHVTPTAGNPFFGVALDRIPPGMIGRAQLVGVVAADVIVTAQTQGVIAATIDTSGAVPYRLALDEAGTADVLAIDAGTGIRRALVRMGSVARGSGGLVFGKIVAPSNNGTTDAIWTVDVYGASVESLRSPALETGKTATQFSASSTYWLGEVVGLRNIGGTYVLQKVLSLPQAAKISRGLLGVRLVTIGVDNLATNFIVDIADVASAITGSVTEAFAVYDWGIYRGVGRFGTAFSAAVVLDSAWEIGRNVTVRTAVADIIPLLCSGASFGLSSAQDSFTIPAFTSGYGEMQLATISWGPAAYVYLAGTPREATQTQGRLTFIPDGSADPTRWAGLATIPSIPGAVDSAYVLLVSFLAMIDDLGASLSGNPVTKLDPELAGYFVLLAGATTPAGVYNVQAYSHAVAGFITVA